MILYKQGNLLREQADALVNTVNCVGVMGRGIALQFKNSFPDNYQYYTRACKQNIVKPGYMCIYATNTMTPPYFIINFPTKRHWRGKSNIKYIDNGIDNLIQTIQKYHITSIAIPPLGCGLGGLHWPTVRKILEQKLSCLPDIQFVIFEPTNDKYPVIHSNLNIPDMTQERAVLVMLIFQYSKVLLDPFMTLLEIHKLMYFMQICGENLKLHYNKAYFGPYAENLRHLLKTIEGFYISGYFDGGDAPTKPITLITGSEKKAQKILEQYPDTYARINHVLHLIDGFESAFGLELLSSVHYLIANESIRSIEALIRGMYSWNARKKQFSKRQIALAAKILNECGWIDKFEF